MKKQAVLEQVRGGALSKQESFLRKMLSQPVPRQNLPQLDMSVEHLVVLSYSASRRISRALPLILVSRILRTANIRRLDNSRLEHLRFHRVNRYAYALKTLCPLHAVTIPKYHRVISSTAVTKL